MDVSRTATKALSANKGSLYPHSCLSKIVWHWAPLDIEAQPSWSISSNIPTCRWTLHRSPAEFCGTLPPLTPPLFTGFFQKKGKADFSMFNVQGMVVTLHRARKESALVCASVEKYILFPCSATKSASNTDRNLPFRGTFLGATAGCLNSISSTYGVLFANRYGFNATDIHRDTAVPTIETLPQSQSRVRNWMIWYMLLSKTDTWLNLSSEVLHNWCHLFIKMLWINNLKYCSVLQWYSQQHSWEHFWLNDCYFLKYSKEKKLFRRNAEGHDCRGIIYMPEMRCSRFT